MGGDWTVEARVANCVFSYVGLGLHDCIPFKVNLASTIFNKINKPHSLSRGRRTIFAPSSYHTLLFVLLTMMCLA